MGPRAAGGKSGPDRVAERFRRFGARARTENEALEALPGVALANAKKACSLSFPFFDRLAPPGDFGATHFMGVFWIRPLVRVRSRLSRAEGLSLIHFRKHNRHIRRNALGCLIAAT